MLLRVWWVLLLLKTLHLSGSEKQQGGCSAIGGHARARHFGGLSAKGWTETSFRMFQKHASDASETSFLGAFDNFQQNYHVVCGSTEITHFKIICSR